MVFAIIMVKVKQCHEQIAPNEPLSTLNVGDFSAFVYNLSGAQYLLKTLHVMILLLLYHALYYCVICVKITKWMKVGSEHRHDTVCIHCQNYTEGTRCEECRRGYFRLSKKASTQPCQK